MLRKIGEIAASDPRSPQYRSRIFFGNSEYEMAPLGVNDLDKLVEACRGVGDEIAKAVTSGAAESHIASLIVKSGVLKKIAVDILGVPEEEYVNTTLANLLVAAGEMLHLNFFVLPESARNALIESLVSLSKLG